MSHWLREDSITVSPPTEQFHWFINIRKFCKNCSLFLGYQTAALVETEASENMSAVQHLSWTWRQISLHWQEALSTKSVYYVFVYMWLSSNEVTRRLFGFSRKLKHLCSWLWKENWYVLAVVRQLFSAQWVIITALSNFLQYPSV